MSDTTFQTLVTPITATWAQDVNNATYRAIGTGAGGTAPSTPAEVRQNIGLTPASGSSLIGYTETGTGATSRTVQTRLQEEPTVKDYGAVGDGVTNDTTAQNNARNKVISAGGGGCLLYPPGSYKVNSKYRNGGITYLDSTWPTDFVEQQRSAFQVLNVTGNSEPSAAFASLSISGTVIPSTRANFVASLNHDMVGTSSWVLRGGTGTNFMEAANFGAWFENNSAQTWVVEIDANNEGANKSLGDQTAGVGLMMATGSTYSPDTAIQVIRAAGAGTGPGWQRGIALQGCRQVGLRIEAMDSTTYPSVSPAAPGTITAIETLKSSDSVARFVMDQDGSMSWGSGSASRDTGLFRSGAAALSVTGALAVSGNLSASNYQTTGNTWTSAITPQTGSFTAASIVASKSVRMGNVIFFSIYYNITTVGTAAGYISFFLPTVCSADGIGQFSGSFANGALVGYFPSGSTNEIRVTKYDATTACVVGDGTISGWYLSNT